MYRSISAGVAVVLVLGALAPAQQSFINFENPHVHPLDMTPDGTTLLAVNTPDNRLEVFAVTGNAVISIGAIPVGLDPVSVRARTDTEVWVVNHISDTVSVVDLTTMHVFATLETADEPADVIFAGDPQRAYVTCSQANQVLVFDPANLNAVPITIDIEGQDPRGLAVSPDGTTVYAAVFESGNRSTILGGGQVDEDAFPPNAVSDPAGPYGGVNPPPNDGEDFNPPQDPGNPAALAVGLIVKQDSQGRWMDDNGGDWTDLVSGTQAALSGRPVGWTLLDHDVAMIDTDTLAVTYAGGLMNACMAIAVNPASGEVTVVGTDGTNEIRFEPNLSGRFLRVNIGLVDPALPEAPTVADLNPHLTYAAPTIDQSERDKSIGDPRGIAWNAAGTRGYVTGMGSNNVVVVDANGDRAGLTDTIEVGEGPTGVVLDEARDRLFVLDKFEAAVSVVETVTETEIARVPFYDPSVPAIKVGRKHLYSTHKNSGLGHIACASCHIDVRMDRLAWDLGDPSGDVKTFNQNCNNGGDQDCEDFHPMKGPMTTQTFQDIIGKEPFHWRGDRDGLEEFSQAFIGLQGDDETLTATEMQEFEDFLATVYFPPNPFRNFDNTLPTDLPLPGHFTTGAFGPAGDPLPNGNAENGLTLFRTATLDQGFECVTCHSLPVGVASNLENVGGANFDPFPTGPNGELHHALVSDDGSTNVSIKVPQLRNLYEKVGVDFTQIANTAGFGFIHDGSVDSLARFVTNPRFNTANDQEVADLVAFMLSFSGSDLPVGFDNDPFELLGPSSQDMHAAVGTQLTITGSNQNNPAIIQQLIALITQAEEAGLGLVAKGFIDGEMRGYEYQPDVNLFQSDRLAEALTPGELRQSATNGGEVVLTLVPPTSQRRIGIDRDEDTHFDRDELDACSNPADPLSTPDTAVVSGDYDGDGDADLNDYFVFNGVCFAGPDADVVQSCRCAFDFDLDADADLVDVADFANAFTGE